MPIRILLVDDHEIVRRGLRAVLEGETDMEVTDEAVNGLDAVEKAECHKPNVVLMDISMPELNGLEAARRIRHKSPSVEVLFLTMHESEQMIREGMDAGGRGFLLKSDAGHELIPVVKLVSRHEPFFSSKIRSMGFPSVAGVSSSKISVSKAQPAGLTARERVVVQLLAEGKSTKQVATLLEITVKTAATHRSNILCKLKLHSIAEIVRHAIRSGIVRP